MDIQTKYDSTIKTKPCIIEIIVPNDKRKYLLTANLLTNQIIKYPNIVAMATIITPYFFRNKTVNTIETTAPKIVDTNCIVFFLSAENTEPKKPTIAPQKTEIKRNGVTYQ